jgi:hypothetical protein
MQYASLLDKLERIFAAFSPSLEGYWDWESNKVVPFMGILPSAEY